MEEEAIDIGAEMGQRDCFSPCSWWMRLAEDTKPGMVRDPSKRKSQKWLLAESDRFPRTRGAGKGVVTRQLEYHANGQAPDMTGQRRSGSVSEGRAIGIGLLQQVCFWQFRVIHGNLRSRKNGNNTAKCRADGEKAGEKVGDRRQKKRGGFYSSETSMRGMTNWRTPRDSLYLSATCACRPFMQAHSHRSQFTQAISPGKPICPCLEPLNLRYLQILRVHGQSQQGRPSSTIIQFLDECIQPWQ